MASAREVGKWERIATIAREESTVRKKESKMKAREIIVSVSGLWRMSS